MRHLIPGASIEETPARLRGPTTPLLEEECDASAMAAVTEVPYPIKGDGPMQLTALSADDQPLNSGEF
jgi:hypothetical protein